MSIRNIMGLVNTTLPFAWDDSLSVYEMLGKLISKINEVVEEVNLKLPDDFVSTIYEKFGEYTSAEIKVIIESGEFATILDSMIVEFSPIKQEVIEARQGALSVGANITEVKSELAKKATKTALFNTEKQLRTELSFIGDGSPKGTYATLLELQTAFPDGDTGIYVLTADGNWYYWNDTEWTKGGVYQAVAYEEFPAINIIKNSDFETKANWIVNGSENRAEYNTLINTGNGVSLSPTTYHAFTDLIIDHKYYFKGSVSIKNEEVDYINITMAYGTSLNALISKPDVNKKYNLSTIATATQPTDRVMFVHRYPDSNTANGKEMHIQYVVGIDLTNAFGAGNEPSLDEMDNIMSDFPNSYFKGQTYNLVPNRSVFNYAFKNKEEIKDLYNLNRTGFVVNTGGTSFVGKQLLGSNQQIEIKYPDGVDGHPTISIPAGAGQVFIPEQASVIYGDELAPSINKWIGENGGSWDGEEWVIPPTGTIKTSVDVVEGEEYQIDITWTDTNFYDEINTPNLIVSLGSSVSKPQFTGYSDALYKLTLVANETGSVELKLGDGNQHWSATVSNVSVRKIIENVSRAGRIGLNAFEIFTSGTDLAIGSGHKNKTSGKNNNAYGYLAQESITTGEQNNAFGTQAQKETTTGCNNNAFGFRAQARLKTGYYNIGIGYAAQLSLVEGSWNIGIGNECLRDLASGHRNTAVGSRALNSLQTGNNNVAIGRQAGFAPKGSASRETVSASNQTLIGMQSGQSSNVQADNLTTLGFQAIGTTNATSIGSKTEANGVGSVAIGIDSESNYAQANKNDEFVLGTNRHHVKVPGRFNVTQVTPTGSADTQGEVGDISTDDNYIYVKTSAGWKRSVLETW